MSTTYLLQDVSSASSGTLWCCGYLKRISQRPLLATAGVHGVASIWDPESPGEPVAQTEKQPLGIVSLVADPSPRDSRYFVTNTIDSKLSRFSPDAKREASVALKPGEAWCMSIHPSSEWLAVGGEDGKVSFLLTAVEKFGEKVATLQAHGSFILSMSFSQDGSLLAVASNTGTVTLFDTQSHALLSSIPAPIRAVLLTPSLLITGSDDSRINIYDLRSLVSPSHASQQQAPAPSSSSTRRGQIFSLSSHASWITSLSLRSNGADRLLASASSDGLVKVWDLQNPTTAIATLRDHAKDVWSVAWEPESLPSTATTTGNASADPAASVQGIKGGFGGGRLASVGEDGLVRWWRGSG